MLREQILRTERLILTTWQPDDVDDLAVIHADPQTMRYVRGGRPESHAQTAALIADYIAMEATLGYTKWRLTDPGDRLVGRAGFGPLDDPRGGRELSYTLHRDQWGHGLATEIGAALIEWHQQHAGGAPLLAYVAMPNLASRRVLTKLGFDSVAFAEHVGVDCELFRYPVPTD